MARNKSTTPLPGSESVPASGAQQLGPADPHKAMTVTVVLRPGQSARALPTPEELGSMLPKDRLHISAEQLAADPEDIAKVTSFAADHGLYVKPPHPDQRTVVLSGPVQALARAFRVKLHNYSSPQGNYTGYSGAIHVPADLAGIVEAVLGLDDRRQATPKQPQDG